jgi:poly(3-hydroxybutyrate) depolymerase
MKTLCVKSGDTLLVNQIPWLAVVVVTLVINGFSPIHLQASSMRPGVGQFAFAQAGKTMPVWYYLPDEVKPDAPVLIVMHGVKRDAERYRDEWLPHARERGFILLVPEFSETNFPGSNSYSLGGMTDDKGQPNPREQWSFSFLEPIFDSVKAATGNRCEKYFLYGHSAGAQFVHRFLYFVPNSRVARAVAANAGWWTMPDLSVEFPYGLGSSSLDEFALKEIFQRPLVILLGTADTDPGHPHLRRTPEAMAQGSHRLARGRFFFTEGQLIAAALNVPFSWSLSYAPDVGHVDAAMAPFAVDALFGR